MSNGNKTIHYVKRAKKNEKGEVIGWDFVGTLVVRPNGNGVLFLGPKDKQEELAVFAKREKAQQAASAAAA